MRVAPQPPVFAKDFYVGAQSDLVINQGGYYINNGACCSMTHSSQCKNQFQSMGADTYEQGTQNRSRSDGGQGSIVRWYGSVMKEMAVVPGSAANSTHKWACAVYCPIEKGDTFQSAITIGDGIDTGLDKPKDLGKESITQPAAIGHTTKVCEHWQWTETLLKVVKMSTSSMFVDNTGKTPAPFFSSTSLTPFGGAMIGQENSSFIGYQPMDVSDKFDIDPASVSSCKMSSKCNPPPAPPAAFTRMSAEAHREEKRLHELIESLNPMYFARERLGLNDREKTILDAATEEAKAHTHPERFEALAQAAAAKDDPSEPNITFVSDFTAHESSIMLISQGGVEINGDPCCSADSPFPQCQIQLQHREGVRYLDVTNQRTRFDDAVSGQNIADIFGNVMKSMLINVTNGKDTCQEYCPIQSGDSLRPIDPFDPFDKIVDKGATTMGGKPVEHYFWADKILKFLTMSKTNFYADIANKKAAIPVFLSQHMTPLGQDLGTTNQTWSNVSAGVPAAAKFAIQGIATCPMSKNCQQSEMLAHYAQSRMHHTLAHYAKHMVPH
jgi:hypothetical protein